MPVPAKTQRAYPLRLNGESPEWRYRLWQTHLAVNRGAETFGDWLLTFRGGLDHTLADPQEGQSGAASDPASTEEVRNRRILLALSWFSVEVGYQGAFAVSQHEVLPKFREVLRARGLGGDAIAAWEADCRDSLKASVKAEAVWVNRSAAFDAAQQQLGPSMSRTEVWDILKSFFESSTSYLAAMELGDEGNTGETKPKDLVSDAGQWLSSRFGTGRGADFARFAKA